METPFLTSLQSKVVAWRLSGREGIEKETRNILAHIERVGFLHRPQIEALETYIYLKEVVGNRSTGELFMEMFPEQTDALTALGYGEAQAFRFLKEKRKITDLLAECFGDSEYANQVYALTMGSGKTVLMAVMMTYDFVLAFYHPEDVRFAKNALVFAPDTTIIESLKEIKTFDYSKILPKEYAVVMLNVKYHYLEDPKTPLSLIAGSNYNVVVSNSQKIIIKTRRVKTVGRVRLFSDERAKEQEDVINKRLRAIRSLANLSVFVDEAHHSYGKTMGDELKKVKQTIEYLHGSSPLVGVVNLTGTPYVNNAMMSDTVYHFGLKQGIERGILKKVSFYKYENVRDAAFVSDVLEHFWATYGERRLEGRLPKIAFYASAIADLQNNLRPLIEQNLRKLGVPTDKILEYHTEAEGGKEAFLTLDTPGSDKQFILLVGKGTEGWNCRSLAACALFRKPKSSIFVLQSSTRCLRAIGDNSTEASIYLSHENHKALDKELRNNFSTSIGEMSDTEQNLEELRLEVRKKKRLKVKKVIREIISVQAKEPEKIKLDLKKADAGQYAAYVTEGGIEATGDSARYKASRKAPRTLKQVGELTFYEILERLNRQTHVSCFALKRMLEANGLSPDAITEAANKNASILFYLADVVLGNVYDYKESTRETEEVIELTKDFPFLMKMERGNDADDGLVVFREDVEGRLGFHINPYNFDSRDEKDIFRYLEDALEQDEAITDVYFTGGIPYASHNEFFVEYTNPEDDRLARYFPDFLIETTKGRYLVIEVKGGDKRNAYEHNKREYPKTKKVFDEVFAKELGFEAFRQLNKQFEYRIIFSSAMREWQRELMDAMRLIK